MYAGIDFGTSSCSIGIWLDDSPKLLPLEGASTRLPSALYTTRSNVGIQDVDASELKKRVVGAIRRQTAECKKAADEGRLFKRLSDSQLENIERGGLRREIAQRAQRAFENQTLKEALYADTQEVFGEKAILLHIQDPQSGYFVKSPKTFLGAKIKREHVELFSEVITRMLAYIKSKAETHTREQLDNIVLGRPVNFHGTSGEIGNAQAVSILERAAVAAGFSNVEFLMEPVAAALDFERKIPTNIIALVLDVGGGTTDCSMIKLGPAYVNAVDRSSSVLGYAGDRIGGLDLDIKLALRKIMPYFGKSSLSSNGFSLPNHIFTDAMAVNDVNAQARFLSESTGRLIASHSGSREGARLQNLYSRRLMVRLNRSAELAKIHLSERDSIKLPLKYIESRLVVP